MTAALEGGEWSSARPCRTLPPGKTRYPLYRRLGGPQGRSGRAENLVPTGICSRTVQPVVSRYTDWATRPTNMTHSDVNSPNLAVMQTSLVNIHNTQAYICREHYIRHNTNDRLNSPCWTNTCREMGGATEVLKRPQTNVLPLWVVCPPKTPISYMPASISTRNIIQSLCWLYTTYLNQHHFTKFGQSNTEIGRVLWEEETKILYFVFWLNHNKD